MSNLTCPGCGSVYPLASVQKFDQFMCAVCHGTIVVPIAGPAPSRAAPPAPSRAVPSAPTPRAAPRAAAPHAARRPVREAPPPSRVNWPLVGMAAAVLGATGVATYLLTDKPTSTGAATPARPAAAEPPPSPPVAPKADPAKDPAAWKALPESERADLVVKYLAALDRRNTTALSQAFVFLRARDEQDAMQKVAAMALDVDPDCGWAHQARGDEMVLDRIERCLAECVRADQVETPGVQKAARLKKAHPPGKDWWADAAGKREVDALLAQIRAEEKELQSPYAWGVARWKAYQRTIEVMKEHPAISDVVGPYLLFVQVKAPLGTPIESVSAEEMNRAKGLMSRSKTLFAAFYDGFHESFGKAFGLARYDGTNLEHATILKANLFADTSTWELYHQRLGFLPFAMSVRAYYDTAEPRFLASYDPGGDEDPATTEQAQCHVGTYQLLHFYTWDLTRKSEGRELSWSECLTRPLWLDHGFAAFFAGHRREGDKFVWMQPLDERLEGIWAWSQALAKRRWAMWSLDELLAVADEDQMLDNARLRVLPKRVKEVTEQQSVDLARAARVMPWIFYCKAWSLVSFLWNQTDAAGRPPYRDGFVRLLNDSLHVKQQTVQGVGLRTRVLTAGDFRKALGLEGEDRFRAFEKEWLAWEAGMLAKAQKPGWAATRDRAVGELTR